MKKSFIILAAIFLSNSFQIEATGYKYTNNIASVEAKLFIHYEINKIQTELEITVDRFARNIESQSCQEDVVFIFEKLLQTYINIFNDVVDSEELSKEEKIYYFILIRRMCDQQIRSIPYILTNNLFYLHLTPENQAKIITLYESHYSELSAVAMEYLEVIEV